jgi:hypothetical protein
MRFDETSGEVHGFRHESKPVQERAPAGRRDWTEERIREELGRFCAGRERWPTAAEFSAAGQASLYLAASRHGGVERWAAELGLHAPSGGRPTDEEAAAAQRPFVAGLAALTLAGFVFVVLVAARPADILRLAFPIAGEPRGQPVAAPARERDSVALRLTADGERTRVAARAWSASGPLLWRGTLAPGRSLRLLGPAIWLEVDAPASLAAFIDGDEARLPRRATRLRVTSRGVQVLARAPLAPRPSAPAPVVASTPPATPAPAPVAAPSGPAPDPVPGGGAGPSPDVPPGPRR